LAELAQHYEAARFQGREKHIQKARSQGKLLVRERIARIAYLLDEGFPFLELLPLAGLGRDDLFAGRHHGRGDRTGGGTLDTGHF
jgi:acetyl-CoA carboxylase carboxyltransferase component